MTQLLLLLVLGAPAPSSGDLSHPPPPRDPARSETLGGARLRAERRLELFNRQLHLDATNVGLWGRINSTRDASIDGQQWPSLQDATLNSFHAE